MKKILFFIVKLLALLLYFLSRLFPRDNRKWVFGEPHGFNNNSKYLFLEILDYHSSIDAVWIGNTDTVNFLKSKGLPAYCRYSFMGAWYCLTAKVYVVSWTAGDINFYLSGGAIIINLWHGTPLKKCLWMEEENFKFDHAGVLRRILNYIYTPIMYFGNLYVNSPSSFYTKIYIEMFRVKKDHVIEDIYPRNKFMLKSKDEILSFLQKHECYDELNLIKRISKFSKILLYAPTYRDSGKDFVKSSGIDFVELDKRLQTSNTCLIVKFHPSTKYDGTLFKGLSNVLFLNNKYDLYPLMPFTDLLISDYSSILFDYMLLKKKMIAFTFDYEQYVSECRELLFDIREGLDGITIVNNAKELEDKMFNNTEKLTDASSILYRKCWQPSENLLERIFKMCNIYNYTS